ncbi:MAG: DUF2703 domain-containing protein [Thermogutta sp.]|uniref:DUF2703 domain-containing protein n=1 Tax=Thermogutta TaxID=1676125 RepID=UPI000BA8A0B6|nr:MULTISPECIES: DUF2703 domain-containing protein [Thermogutta]MBC7354039.1 DUF2703 domain-containing protein [Thermogutta sp.]
MPTLTITWQRVVDDQGNTCSRCGATEQAVDEAVRLLNQTLKTLGICVVAEKKTLTPAEFSRDPLQSNRVFIQGRPLEDWLGATVGKSPCCSVCGDAECRTLTVEGTTYESIPSELIIKAGLLAAAEIVAPQKTQSCCCRAEPPGSSHCCG